MDAIPVAADVEVSHLAEELAFAIKAGTAAAFLARAAGVAGEAVARRVAARAPARATLAGARRVVAELFGFASFAALARHVAALRRAGSATARFEAAADAVVDGDAAALDRVIADDPGLPRARSDRRHRATLLHYVAANGVEDFRQRTPANIVAIARRLLAAGAEVDAANDDYGGRGTALGLVATSVHPERAGAQEALLELLLAAGADVEGLPGSWRPLPAALANGQPRAAAWLVAHGAALDLETAAGTGQLEVVEAFLAEGAVPPRARDQALLFAAASGRAGVVELLLDAGADVAAGDGQTALHLAVHAADLTTVKLLVARGAPLEQQNRFGGTALSQALWSAVHTPERDYAPVVAALVAAGAEVDRSWWTGIAGIDAILRGG